MKKYLFLDIDGVLNHEEWFEKRVYDIKNKQRWEQECFDPLCVERVNRILNSTGASLVVSSSWRNNPNLKYIFNIVGLPIEFDVTPNFVNIDDDINYWPSRGQEIDKFIESHECDNYVILDDDIDFTEDQIKNHFVHCCPTYVQSIKEDNSWNTGLTEEKAQLAIKILNNE